MAAYRLVYDSRHLQADCQELRSAPELYARQSSMATFIFYIMTLDYCALYKYSYLLADMQCFDAVGWAAGRASGL